MLAQNKIFDTKDVFFDQLDFYVVLTKEKLCQIM